MSNQGNNPANLVELFESSVKKYPKNELIGSREADNQYHWINFEELARRVDNFRGGLASIGIGEGDAVGIIGKNSVDWAVGAYATYGLGAHWVPMYEAELESIRKYIITDAKVKAILVSNPELIETLTPYIKEIPSLETLILIPGDADGSMAALERIGEKSPVASLSPDEQKIANIIYTSGTTGDPKGVLLSHKNLASNAMSGGQMVTNLDQHSRSLSILPWAHAYGQTAELNNFIVQGGSIGLAEGVATIAQDILDVQPTHLIAVPRVFNKMYSGILRKIDEQGGLPKFLFEFGMRNVKKKRELAAQGKKSRRVNFKAAIADKLVFSKIRAKFGGRLRVAVTGSATMDEEIAKFFFDLGITTLDCYGLTETSPAATMNTLEDVRFGTVGRAIPNVTISIDKSLGNDDSDDGEVVIHGPNIMVGYHNKPEATAAVMTEDGGFRTGDLGRLDKDGYLSITGRIKEQYKLSNGKYVFPAGIEESIKLIPEVANAMLYGAGKDFNICIIIPDFESLAGWISKNNLPNDPNKLISDPTFEKHITDAVNTCLEGKFGKYEIPKKILLLPEDFSIESGMLTQTLKLKRRVVLDHYADAIDALYV